MKDVIGEVYNKYTIIENLPPVKYGSSSYKRVKAKCSCGNERELCYKDLKRGRTKSCGCENKLKVLSGDTFGFWTIVEESGGYYGKKEDKVDRAFMCKCICGKEREVSLQSLRAGKSRSCGCLGLPKKVKKERIKAIPTDTEEEQWAESKTYMGYYVSSVGRLYNQSIEYMFGRHHRYYLKQGEFKVIEEMYKSFIGDYNPSTHYVYLRGDCIVLKNISLESTHIKNKLYAAYSNMYARCKNQNVKSYKDYGARGIEIEESFNTFSKFFNWACDNNYQIGLELDRIDNNGNYSVENCRWVTKAENSRNTRKNKMNWEVVNSIRYGEYKERSDSEIAELLGCTKATVKNVREFKSWVIV